MGCIAYVKRLRGDSWNDTDLDSCQGLVGDKIGQLKRTSERNAVIADRSRH